MVCTVVGGDGTRSSAGCVLQETEKRLSNDATPNPDQADAEPHLISTSDQEPCDIVYLGTNADVH